MILGSDQQKEDRVSDQIARSHFSTPKLIAGFSAVAVILVLGIVWFLCSALVEVNASEDRHLHIQRLCGTIIHLDEVLTMSAKMCAATGSMEWKKRYDRYELTLDKAIQQAEALVPLSGPEPSEDISVVNARLVDVEKQAFRLTAQGMRQEAMALLESDQYKLDKQKYSVATEDRIRAMLEDVRSSLKTQRWKSRTIIAGAVVVMCLILGTGFISTKAMRQHLAQLKWTEESLREAHETLENKVEERTAELVIVNEKLRSEIAQRQHSEETARALLNAPTESLLMLEPDGTIATLNEAAARRLGNDISQLIGQCAFDLMPADLSQCRRVRSDEVIRTGEPVCIEDQRDGRVFDSRIYPVFNGSGKVTRLAVYAQDITERRAAEEAVQKEQQHLRHSLEASDRERQVIVYDIHDGVAQHLSAAAMHFQTAASIQSKDSGRASAAFDTGMELLGHALTEARRLIGGVRPPILDDLGIVAAVEHLVSGIQSKGGPEVELDIDVEFRRLIPSVENSLFRIIQESLTNACTHSESDRVRIAVHQQGETLHIEIQDWGIGFVADNLGEGIFGLESIRERARLLGGNAIITSEPGKGTRVAIELPVPESA